jgi:hypothetical protein
MVLALDIIFNVFKTAGVLGPSTLNKQSGRFRRAIATGKRRRLQVGDM